MWRHRMAKYDRSTKALDSQTPQLMDFVDKVNRTSQFATPGCKGILVVATVQPTGLGGTLNATFVCNDCQLREINFQGSAIVEGLRRTQIGLALSVAFLITGHGFEKYDRTLRQYLGISCLSKNRYYDMIELVYPHINDILEEMCEDAKDQMKEMDDDQLGSWARAVVTSDGVWHTKGHFSKNGTFVIKNYLSGGLLWYGHKCMQGNDNIVEEDLYEGTSKSMEGVLASECYGQAKEEGANIEAVWQDGDSSSGKSVKEQFPNGQVLKCGGHVGRAHTNNLKDFAKVIEFYSEMKRKYKDKFLLVETAKCKCFSTRHKADCGCLSEAFIKAARINHFCCLQQCKDPSEYARRMRALSKYHARDEHNWDDSECGFHPQRTCTCKKCDEDDEPKCVGKVYKTKNVVSCDFQWLCYQIECERRAEDAESVIYPQISRGHSNLCEAHFTVLPQFRAKDQSLNRLHYGTSTNCGLCRGNMSWCYDKRGPHYHWVTDLYQRLKLPIIPAVVEALHNGVEERRAVLEKQKTEAAKANRIKMKVARTEDQTARKKWVKRQAVQHSYGRDDDDLEDDNINPGDQASEGSSSNTAAGSAATVVSGKTCSCGRDHKRTSHTSCPLNKKNL